MIDRRIGAAAVAVLAGTAWAQVGVPYRVADLPRGDSSAPSNRWTDLGLFARLGDRTVFIANDGWLGGREPWITDGTPEGTRQITDLDQRPGMDFDPVAVLAFEDHGIPKVAYAGSRGGLALAFTDGTASGTVVSEPMAGSVIGMNGGLLGVLDGRIVLAVIPPSGSGQELWIAGPNPGDTRRLALIPPGYSVEPLFAGEGGGRAYVWLCGTSGRRLWSTDGTPEGMGPVAGVPEAYLSRLPGSAVVGGTLILSAPQVVGTSPYWALDLATQAVQAIALPSGVSPQAGPVIGIPGAGFALISATGGLWRTDGTAEGTFLFKPDVRAVLNFTAPEATNTTLGPPGARHTLFYGSTTADGEELWTTDGTPEGTQMLVSLAAGSQSAEAVIRGISVFEGLRGYWNERQKQMYAFRVPEHFVRLEESMKILHLQLPYPTKVVEDAMYELIRRCEGGPWRQMLAVIGDSANAASIGLHRALGFEPVGTFESVGFKFGRWLDTVLMQGRLGAGSDSLPG